MQGSQQQQNSYLQSELPPNTQNFVTRTVEYRNGNISNSQSSPNRVSAPISMPPPIHQYYAPIEPQPQPYTQNQILSHINPDQNRTSTTYVYTSTTTNQNQNKNQQYVQSYSNDIQGQRLNEGQPRSNM